MPKPIPLSTKDKKRMIKKIDKMIVDLEVLKDYLVTSITPMCSAEELLQRLRMQAHETS
jgi:hypothetical protein